MKRLNTLAPNGLNLLENTRSTLHLVLPFSGCSNRVVRTVQSIARDVTTIGSFTAARNLRGVFRSNRF